jgi:hypothetical protein
MCRTAYEDGYSQTRILFTGDTSTDRADDEQAYFDQMDEIMDKWETDFLQRNGRLPTGEETNAKYLELTGRRVDEECSSDDSDLPF